MWLEATRCFGVTPDDNRYYVEAGITQNVPFIHSAFGTSVCIEDAFLFLTNTQNSELCPLTASAMSKNFMHPSPTKGNLGKLEAFGCCKAGFMQHGLHA